MILACRSEFAGSSDSFGLSTSGARAGGSPPGLAARGRLASGTSRGFRSASGRLPAPPLINLVVGGKTPMLTLDEIRGCGFAVVLYANAALQATIKAVQGVLGHLKANGSLEGVEGAMASFVERQRLVGKPAFDAREARYAGG